MANFDELNLNISIDDIFDKLIDRFFVILLSDNEKEVFYPIKISKDIQLKRKDEDFLTFDELEKNIRCRLISEYANSFVDYVSFDNQKRTFKNLNESYEFIYQLKDNTWNKAVFYPMEIKKGIVTKTLFVIYDITESKHHLEEIAKKAEKEKKKAENYRRLFFDSACDMYEDIYKCDTKTLNIYRVKFKGEKNEDELVGTGQAAINYIVRVVHNDDLQNVKEVFNFDYFKRMRLNEKVKITYRSIANNEYRWHTTTITKNSNGIVTSFTLDIDNEMKEKKKLLQMSENDPLTGLYNRNKLELMIENEFSRIVSCGIIYVNINKLKEINDMKGHEVGDEIVTVVANSLKGISSHYINVFRYSGSEFIIVTMNMEKDEIDVVLSEWKEKLTLLVKKSKHQFSVSFGKSWAMSPFNVNFMIKSAIDSVNHK